MRDDTPNKEERSFTGVVEAFELAWQSGTPPDIGKFLNADAPDRLQLLWELVHVDLKHRFRAGAGVCVETYWERFPELAQDPEAVLDLISAEWSYRTPRTETGGLDEFLERFPEQRHLLTGRLLATAATEAIGVAAAPLPEKLPRNVGRYRLERELARGGMGLVLRVQDEQFDRPLAMKVVLRKCAEGPGVKERFLREARLTGQMQHPGVPPVQEMGALPDGRPYFIMKLVKGQNLHELLRARTALGEELPRFVSIFEQVCQTMAYAHARQIVHRDLKPNNIMVGAFGEVQVMDWGLAKVLDLKPRQGGPDQAVPEHVSTVFSPLPSSSCDGETPGSVVGTPAYMAPEQARGEVEQLDARCDVFGLGGLLCVILTGKPPFNAGTSLDNHRAAMKGDVADAMARLDGCGADPDLVALAKRCLAAEPGARPADAGALAAAVADYLARLQERVQKAELERQSAEIRAGEERKRRRLWRGLAGAVAALVVAVGSAGYWALLNQAEQERQEIRAAAAIEARFGQLGRFLESSEPVRAREVLEDINVLAANLAGNRFGQRQAAARRDLEMLEKLDALLARRWQVVQEGSTADVVLTKAGRDRGVPREASRAGLTSATTGDTDPKALPARIARRTDPAPLRHEFQKTFAEYGLPVGELPPDELARRARAAPIRRALSDGLLQWFLLARDLAPLRQLIGTLGSDGPEPDPLRVLAGLEEGRDTPDEAAFEELSTQPGLVIHCAELMGDDDKAIALLQRALAKHAGDARLYLVLASRLLRSPSAQPADATAYARAAYALKSHPHTGIMLAMALAHQGLHAEALHYGRHNVASAGDPALKALAAIALGHVLAAKGDHAAAIEAYQQARGHEPLSAHYNIAVAHHNLGEFDQAKAWCAKALSLDPRHVATHHHMGRICHSAGDHGGAIAWYKKTIALAPHHAAAHNNIGVIFNEKRDFKESRKWLEKALELDPLLDLAHSNIASSYHVQKQYAEAIKHCKKALALNPRSGTLHNQLGWAYTDLGAHDEAAEALKKALELNPRDPWPANNLGVVYQQRKRPDEAITWYKQAIAVDPKFVMGHNNLGVLYRSLNDYDEAARWFEKVLKLDPRNVGAHTELGFLYNAKGQYDEAIKWYTRATELDPKEAWAYNGVGLGYEFKKMHDTAIGWYRQALKADPRHFWAHCNLGDCYRVKKEYTEALSWYAKALAIDPQAAAAYNGMGLVWTLQRKYKEALAWYQKALKADPRSVQVHVNLGDCHRALKEYRDALRWYEKTLELDPKQESAYNGMGLVFESQAEYDEAIKAYTKVLEIDRKHFWAHYNLGDCYRKKAAFDEAFTWYRKALDLDPRHADTHNLIGLTYELKKEVDEAIRWYKKVLDIDPQHPYATYNLGDCYRSKQQYDVASAWYDKAIKLRPDEVDAHNQLLVVLGPAKRIRQAVEAADRARRLVPSESWPALRYNAACAYALAGCGRDDAAQLEAAERKRLRGQALVWLGEHKKDWAALVSKCAHKEAAQQLQHVLQDDDFAGVRDAEALSRLDAGERESWQQFWNDVRALLKRAQTEPMP